MKIYITFSKKEVRRVCFTNSFWDVIRWRLLLMFVLILAILSILSLAILDPTNIQFAAYLAVMVAGISIVIIGLRVLHSGAAILSYRREKTRSDQDYLETNDDGIVYVSDNMRNVYWWRNIQHVYETKNFFFIVLSREQRLAIPRRCFADQIQLDAFIAIMNQNIKKGRLHWKHYPVGVTAPESIQDGVSAPIVPLGEEVTDLPDEEKEMFNIRFLPHAIDIIVFSLREYFISGVGFILTLLGLLLSFPFVFDVFDGSIWHQSLETVIILSAFLLVGLFFLLFVPVLLYIRVRKQFGKGSNPSTEFAFHFYKDFYLAELDHRFIRFYWKDLVKVSETRPAYYLYIAKNTAHIIPKRAFADAEGKEKMMQTCMIDARILIRKS